LQAGDGYMTMVKTNAVQYYFQHLFDYCHGKWGCFDKHLITMKKLLLTCFLLGVFFFQSLAGIVYTNLSPVKTLSQSTGTWTNPAGYMTVDIDNNGSTDFLFRIDHYSASDYYAHIFSQYPTLNYVAGIPGSYVQQQTAGNSIGAASSWTTATSEPFLGDSYSINLINKGDVLIALKFKIGSNYHFGWMRVNVALGGGALSVTVKNYAYENVANTAITAGSTGTLPLQLEYFTAARNKEAVILQWSVLNAVDVHSFVIERSVDAQDYVAVGAVPFSGESKFRHNIVDAATGNTYYRLRIMDKDGSFSFSPVIKAGTFTTPETSVWPNPCRDNLQLSLYTEVKQPYQVNIMSVDGRTMVRSAGMLQAGTNTIILNTHSLLHGLYVLRITTGDQVTCKTFVKH